MSPIVGTITLSPSSVWDAMPNRNWDANVWVSDNRKILAQLDWQPRRTFAEGFRMMVDWFRQGPPPGYAGKREKPAA